ncbi:Sodium Bile acid symporter family protein [Aquisphaera giovannonii]|uniref:Sodium Bile acid symporter family protein n=1 Tax=Aquisphaera giovannonii TaxID=406548 RepID=A0A5B9W386_9BACT|nr:bile acid:sodium symporter [Aquisphaera giovannonii]QEH35076.1 Sodium Bile acid symporter family protein [Aquisphaera giovannonii]
MTAIPDRLSAVSHFLHRHLLKLIILSYGLAALIPGPGLWIKEADVPGLIGLHGWPGVTPPKLLLWLLLFNAGLRVRVGRVGQLARRPGMVLAGLAANLAVPLAFLALMIPMLRAWHNPDEAAVVLVGLALVSSMPIAGSSTGWAQAADGDMALSLGLVLGSTLLSPISTPAALHALGLLAPGPYGGQLHQLAGRDTGTFLAAWVLLPSVLGIAARAALGEARAPAVERRLRIAAPLTLMILCYANASACLPQAIRDPDWDFLGIVLAFVAGLCTLTFAAGHLVGRMAGADRGQRVALMFGLGMNNNGTGLVLASMSLGAQPLVMLPIIVYNLAQHLIAGGVNALLRRAEPA